MDIGEPHPKTRLFTALRNKETGGVYLVDGMEVVYGPNIDRQCIEPDPRTRIKYYIFQRPGPDIYDLIYQDDSLKKMYYQFEKRKFYRKILSGYSDKEILVELGSLPEEDTKRRRTEMREALKKLHHTRNI